MDVVADNKVIVPACSYMPASTPFRIASYERPLSPSEPSLAQEAEFIEHLVEKNGPEPTDCRALNDWFDRIHRRASNGGISGAQRLALRDAFGDAVSGATLQGLVCTQPHGYPGDFEIIDKIYVRHHSPHPRFLAWDAYFHSQVAPKAVRNRKPYFHCLLDAHYQAHRPLRVLKLASGPGRCMFEWLSDHPDADVAFHCVELDLDAIAYARALNQDYLSRIDFSHQNAVRFRAAGRYDLIWVAGLFDYFADRVFQSVLRRLIPAIGHGGELVIGNFSLNNPSRAWMEFGGWMLHHRSADDLVALASSVGVPADAIRIGSEPEGVNLFLHIKG
jgi:extracellular factor (EF) 3-hydroxypalmitic acid methyl ester biosynthesis protein